MKANPDKQGVPFWILAVIVAGCALSLCCCGGVAIIANRGFGTDNAKAPARPVQQGQDAKQDTETSDIKPLVTKIRVAANRPWQDSGVELVAGSKVTVAANGNWSKGALTCASAGLTEAANPRKPVVSKLQEVIPQLSSEYNAWQNKVYPASKFGPTPNERREREEKMIDLRRQIAEANQKIKEENARWTETLAKAFPSRPAENAPPLCLILKIGANGDPMPGQQSFRSERGGRLFFQANDTDLAGNDGSLDVEITVVVPPAPKWVGDVKVELLLARPWAVNRKDFGAWRVNEMLVVKLRLTNTSPTKMVRFGRWHGIAGLSDEHANEYKAVDFGTGLGGFGDMPGGPEDVGSDTSAILASNRLFRF